MKFAKKVAVVTGGSRGIGYQIATRLVDEGANVIILSRRGRLENESDSVNQIWSLKVDVAVKSEIDQAFRQIYEKFGRIDILVNCAGICKDIKTIEITEQQWDRMLAVNLKGVFFCCQAVYQNMADQKYGKIVNITSLAGKTGPGMVGAHYAASKAGVISLTKKLAKDLAAARVNVNAIAPTITDTDMKGTFTETQLGKMLTNIPLGRMATPDDIAKAVLFLASDDAAFITGEILDVNGGEFMD
jgi:3-oxoacyl-[acyl-carrier protein] reductase